MKYLKYSYVLALILFYSCLDNDSNNLKPIDDFNTKTFKIIANYNNTKIGVDNDNIYNYFVDNKLQNKIIFNENLQKKINESYNTVKINDSTVRIINSKNNAEYYELRNLKSSGNYKNFDVYYNTEDLLLEGIEIQFLNQKTNQTQAKCPLCLALVAVVIEAYIEVNSDSECETAVKQCTEAGGLPTTKIEETLFSKSCEVTCNSK